MFSLTEVLRRRERSGRNAELKSWLNKKTQYNITHDKCLTKKMVFEKDIEKIGRCNDWVATLDGENQLSLYDIALQKKVWSIPVKNIERYYRELLKVTHDGLVLYIAATGDENKCADIQIFFQGEKIGGFWIDDPDFLLSSLRIIENRIFGISQSEDSAIFYEWNTAGTPVRLMTINGLNVGKGALTDCSNKYYVVSAQSKGIPVFVFNLVANEEKIFSLVDDKEMKIESIFLMKDRLICGTHYDLMGQHSIPISRFPEIRIFNIETGGLDSQYSPERLNGRIYKIIANDRYIVFFHNDESPTDNLYCVDIQKGALKKIKSFSYLMGVIMNASFEGNLLTVCYSERARGPSLKRCVINLDSAKEVQEVQYKRHSYSWHKFSFENSKLLIPAGASEKHALFIEDFNHIGPEEKPNPENSMRMRPS